MHRPSSILCLSLSMAAMVCIIISSFAQPADAQHLLRRADIDRARAEQGLPSLDETFESGARPFLSKGPDTPRPFLDGPVYAMIEFQGSLIVAGEFNRARATAGILASDLAHVNNIARWDGTQWHYMGSGINGPVYALATI